MPQSWSCPGPGLGTWGAGSRQSHPTLRFLVLPAVLEGDGLAEQAGMWGDGGRTISPGDPGRGSHQRPHMGGRSRPWSPEPSSGPAPDAHGTQRTLALPGSPTSESALGGRSCQYPKGAGLSPGARVRDQAALGEVGMSPSYESRDLSSGVASG